MENLTPQLPANKKTINSFGVGRFMVDGQTYNHAILCDGDNVYKWEWNGVFDDNFINSMQPLGLAGLELLLIGFGNILTFPPPHIRVALNKICPTESMITASAARTYCFALAEGRKVGVALVPLT